MDDSEDRLGDEIEDVGGVTLDDLAKIVGREPVAEVQRVGPNVARKLGFKQARGSVDKHAERLAHLCQSRFDTPFRQSVDVADTNNKAELYRGPQFYKCQRALEVYNAPDAQRGKYHSADAHA